LRFEERGKAPVKGRRAQVTIYNVTRSKEEQYGDLRRRAKSLVLIALLAGAGLVSSCAWEDFGLRPSEPAIAKDKPEERVVFRSEDYAVLRLRGGENAQSLAREFLGDPRKAWVIEEANRGTPLERIK